MDTEKSRLIVLLACLPIYAADATQFEEVTANSGIDYIGQSKGVAWVDYNVDGWPDVWVTNRYNKFRLYVNNGDGTFTDSSSVITSPTNSAYGAAWGDFDNDGDPDILNAGPGACSSDCGSPTSNTLLVNDSGLLVDQAKSYGVDYPLGRGRMPLWFDWNADGRLDLLVTNLARADGVAPTALFTQDTDGFLDDTELAVISAKSSQFAQLASFAPGSPPRLVLSASRQYPLGIYDYSVFPFLDIKEDLGLPVISDVQDAIIADFNGDLFTDVFVARASQYHSAVVLIDANLLGAYLVGGNQKAFRFKAKGNVRFQIFGNSSSPSELNIGKNATVKPDKLRFTLSDSDPAVIGIQPHEPGADTGIRGIYIGYQPADGFWEVQLSSPKGTGRSFLVEADSPISELSAVGFDSSDDGERTDRLFLQTANGFLDTAAVAGLDTPTSCGSAVSADFDNDMDLDIYMACRGAITNRANILYENLGDGTFRAEPEAGGAAGSTLGRGDSVATADFDLDGFMDILVTNGDNQSPFNIGPHQLFRNLGNENHWLEIDLEGTSSNRDGIGAQVLATAAGITQVRDQNGGFHLFSQNHQRIHFGLGHNTVMDRIEVHWPSGIVQNIYRIPADQIIRVVEPSAPSIYGKPQYSRGQDIGVYIWKNVADEFYHLRVSGDGPLTEFNISIIAEEPFGSVTSYGLEGDDIFEWTDNYINLTSRVTTSEDGLDFSLPFNTKAIISVEQDGKPNPRQLHIGASGGPLSPSGWIVDIDSLPDPPTFQRGEDLGLFLGRDPLTGSMILRWNGDGNPHIMDLVLVSSQPLGEVVPVAFEQDQDFLHASTYTLYANGAFSTSWDGIDAMIKPASKLGLTYTQDGLFPSHLVNPFTRDLGLPNAFWLPTMGAASGRPNYDPGSEQEIFFWKANSGVWRFRGTAGGDYARYTGTITADAPAIHVDPVMLEVNDILDAGDLRKVNFDIQMMKHWEDGIDIQFPEGTQLCVAIETPGDQPVLVGQQRIPVISPFDPVSLDPCDSRIR